MEKAEQYKVHARVIWSKLKEIVEKRKLCYLVQTRLSKEKQIISVDTATLTRQTRSKENSLLNDETFAISHIRQKTQFIHRDKKIQLIRVIKVHFFALQRQLLTQKMKLKRQNGAGGMVKSSDLSSTRFSNYNNKWANTNKDVRGK